MPDRTASGRTVEELSAKIKRRRAELTIKATELENDRLELDILAQEEQVLKHRAAITANEQRIAELRADLGPPPEGGT